MYLGGYVSRIVGRTPHLQGRAISYILYIAYMKSHGGPRMEDRIIIEPSR